MVELPVSVKVKVFPERVPVAGFPGTAGLTKVTVLPLSVQVPVIDCVEP